MPPYFEDMLPNDIRPFKRHPVSFGDLSSEGWCSAYFPDPVSQRKNPEMILGSAHKNSDGYTIYVAPNQVYFADLNGVLLPGKSFTRHPKHTREKAHAEKVDSIISLSLAVGITVGLVIAESPQLREDLSSSFDSVRVAVTQLIFE